MLSRKVLPIIGLILVLALAACLPATTVPEQSTPLITSAPQTQSGSTAAPSQQIPQTGGTPAPAGQVTTYAQLFSALSGMSGLTVQQQGTVQQPLLNMQAQQLSVNGQQIQAVQFGNASEREQAQSVISKAGSQIGGFIPSIVSTPRLWGSGPLLVLYTGQDTTVINALTSVLGPEIDVLATPTATPDRKSVV